LETQDTSKVMALDKRDTVTINYDGRNCYIDDSYLGGKATIIVDFTSSNGGGSDTSIVKLDALICKTVVV
jgi:hypothetical protein